MIGKRLAHYEIIEKIGAGGMGEVYRARDTRLDRDVAVKLLPEEFANDFERSARFEREAKAVAALSHPNILSIYDFGSDDGQAFAVTELLDGESLSDRLLRGPISQRKTIELAVQLANGLAAAHSHGIIHRDIKPANIFVTRDGRAKILDFGLARMDAPDPNLTQSPTVGVQTDPGAVMGTVGYMSPEQVRGEPVDARSDIFSFGAVLYEMLSGKRAFNNDTTADAIGSILRDEPSALHELDSSIKESLNRIVQHCMEKSPEERFQSARDLGFALATASSTSQPSTTSVGAPARHRGLSRSMLIILAVIGWAAAAMWFVQLQTSISEPFVPTRLTSLTYSGRDWAPDVSPNGDFIAFVSDRDGTAKIWLKQVGGGGAASITDGPDDIPRFSPDGSQILFVRDEGVIRNLYRTTVVGAQPRKMLEDAVEADWSPDGSEVAFIRLRASGGDNIFTIGIADAQTGSERILVEVTNRAAYGIRWSPTGERLAVNETSLTGNVADESYIDLIDTRSGELERRALTDWGAPYTAVDWAPSGRSVVVGQAGDMLSHASGSPGQIMEYDFDTGERVPLFWTSIRTPRGGWGFSSLAVLNTNQVVVDNDAVQAQLHETGWPGTPGAGSRRVLTNSMGRDRQPAHSPDGSQVIFSSNRSGNIDLWLVERASGRVTQITDDLADDWDPAFSPDGKSLLWSSNRSGNMEIWMAAVDGSHARQMSNDGIDAENPTMTRNGKWVVYSSANDEYRGIWRIRPDGSDATLIAPGAFIIPDVSPDGRYVVFAQFRNLNYVICVVEIESAVVVPFEIELSTIERHVNITFGRCRWTPDGKGIVFIGQNEAGRSGVFVQDFKSGVSTIDSRRQVAGFAREYTTESLGVSPDGKSIIISAMYDRRGLNLAEQVRLRLWK